MRLNLYWTLSFLAFLPNSSANVQDMAEQGPQEQMTVSLREMRLNVYDSAGMPYLGLKAEDLELSVNGVTTPITFFQEVRSSEQTQAKPMNEGSKESAKSEIQTHFWLILLDSGAMSSQGFKEMKAQVRRFIETMLQPNDLVRLAVLDGNFRVLVPFTNERKRLLEALEGVEYQGKLRNELDRISSQIAMQLDKMENEYISVTVGQSPGGLATDVSASGATSSDLLMEVDAKERLKANHFLTYYNGMQVELQSLAGLKGPKTCLVFTGGFYLESLGNFKNTQRLADGLAASMNRASVTFYAMLVQDLAPIGQRHINTTKFSMDDSAVFNLLSQGDTSGRNIELLRGVKPQNTLFENLIHAVTGPKNQAEQTGGLLEESRGGKLAETLDRLVTKISNYYRIGYAPPEGVNKQSIRLTLKDPSRKLKLSYGKELSKEDTGIREEADEDELNLLYTNSFRNELEIRPHYSLIKRKEGFAVPVSLTLPEAQQTEEQWVVGFAALDASRSRLDSTLSKVKFEPLRESIHFHDLLLLNEAPHFLRFYVKESSSGNLSLLEVPIPAPGVGADEMGPLVFMRPKVTAMALHRQRKGLKTEHPGPAITDAARVAADPFSNETQILIPYEESVFTKSSALPVWLCLPDTQPDSWKLAAELQDGKGSQAQSLQIVKTRIWEDKTLFELQIKGEKSAGPWRLSVSAEKEGRKLKAEADLRVLREQSEIRPEELDKYLLSIAAEADLHADDIQKAIDAGGSLSVRDEKENGLMSYAAMGLRPNAVSALLKLGVPVDVPNRGGMTASMAAAMVGFDAGLALLLDAGANPEALDQLGNGIWHYAAMDQSGAAARLLLTRQVKQPPVNRMGDSAIVMAALQGNSAFLKELAKAGTDLNLKDAEGSSLLHIAAGAENEAAFAWLLETKPNLEGRDRQGFTPLHLLAQSGKLERLKKLLDLGAKIEAKSENGETPLLVAAAAGNLEAAQELLSRGADRKAKFNGLNALQLAAINGKLEMVRFLIQAKFNPEDKSPQGLKAIDYAKQGNHEDIVNFLSGEKSDFEWWDEAP